VSPPVLFLIGVLLTVAIAGEIVGASLADRASYRAQQLARARSDLDALAREQLADEGGLRGFVATGQRSYLAQATSGGSFDERAENVRGEFAAAAIAPAAAALASFDRARRRWAREIERPLLDDPSRTRLERMQGRSKSLLEAMNAQADALREMLDAAEAENTRKLRNRINATVGVSIGTITIFALAAIGLSRSRREAVRALVREQSFVAALQQTLRVDGVALPRTAVGFAYSSATREALVGGDLLDAWRVDAHRGWFLIADVSGKGIEAARHSAFVQYAIRTLCAEFDDPALVLARFNALFLDTFDDDSIFVVAFLGSFDARSGELRYASAGHGIAFVRRSGGIEQLAPTGPIIGMDRDEAYAMQTLALVPGETLILATDGLTECRDASGAMLGDEGVLALLAGASAGPQAVCDRLVAEVHRRSPGEANDDLAILVLQILGADSDVRPVAFSTLSA
jgi:hypothetical protein